VTDNSIQPSRYETPETTDRTIDAADFELARGIRDAVREGLHMVRLLEDEGVLTLTQIGILNTLATEPQPIGLLANLSGMTQPGMSQQIDKLQEAGVVRRVKGTRDARVTMVELTDKGREVRARDNELRDTAIASRFDLMSDEDRAAIERAVEPMTRFAASYVERVRNSIR
jgi:DNA-binding MarR family transcriptional regulator